MRKIYGFCFCFFSALTVTAQVGKDERGRIKHVVVIGVDGFSASGLKKAATPFMDQMIKSGAVSYSARTVLPSISSPNWASMVLGAGPEQHGVLNNDWRVDEYSLEPVVADSSRRFPSIFTIARTQLPKAEIGAIHNWGGFGDLFQHSLMSYHKHYSKQDETVAAFAAYLQEKKPTLAWLHLDEVDHAGHNDGHGTPVYLKAVSKVDSCVGVVLDAIQKAGMEKNTMVMVVSDHGGTGMAHGGYDLEEVTVPIIYYGAGIKQGYLIQQQIYQYDVAATIAFALKLQAPYAWIGRPVKAAFKGFKEPENLWMGVLQTPAPIIHPDAQSYGRAGGLYVDKIPSVEITVDGKPGGVIKYTTDGTDPIPSSATYNGPFQLPATTVVKARFYDEKKIGGKVAVAYFRMAKSNQGNGVKLRFYEGQGWEKLPDFSRLTSISTWNDYEFNINRDQVNKLKKPEQLSFGVVAESFLEIDEDGEYQFYSRSDDGTKLYINDELVVDNDGDHAVIEQSGKIKLKKGRHAIKVDFINVAGDYWLDLYYRGPGLVKQIIPANRLFLSR